MRETCGVRGIVQAEAAKVIDERIDSLILTRGLGAARWFRRYVESQTPPC